MGTPGCDWGLESESGGGGLGGGMVKANDVDGQGARRVEPVDPCTDESEVGKCGGGCCDGWFTRNQGDLQCMQSIEQPQLLCADLRPLVAGPPHIHRCT